MTEQDEVKSLSSWRLDIQRFGNKTYLRMYSDFLGTSVSNIPRFYRAIKLYGDYAVFEAIVACADQEIKGDPLNYFLAVTKAKWKEAQQDEEEEINYLAELEAFVAASQKRNDELAKKLKRKK